MNKDVPDYSNHLSSTEQTVPTIAIPPTQPPEKTWRYGVCSAFQIAPTQAAVICNIRQEYENGNDFEVGSDIVVFDDLTEIDAAKAIPVSRSTETVDSQTGSKWISLSFPVSIGFVPLGAKLKDGADHPHAGTGFGLNTVVRMLEGCMDGIPTPDPSHRGTVSHEFRQIFFNGTDFFTGDARTMDNKAFSSLSGGMSSALPAGTDLLLPSCTTDDDKTKHCGVSTWKRIDNQWQPVTFRDITPPGWGEPSMIRNTDGTLLFTARPFQAASPKKLIIWHSADNGQSWHICLDSEIPKTQSPLAIGQTTDGTTFICSNMDVPFDPGRFSESFRRNRANYQKAMRVTLAMWKLTANFNVCSPSIVKDFYAGPEFNTPPEDSYWRIDHPAASTVRLADRKWHSLIGYRIMFREDHFHSGHPKPETGAYLSELDQQTEDNISQNWWFD